MKYSRPSRRQFLQISASLLGLGAAGVAHAGSDEPIRLGLQWHGSGIGAAYGRWYRRTAEAAVALINAEGGINGRPAEMIVEDDATDPRRAAETIGKFAHKHQADVIFGGLFSHVVMASAQPVGEFKIPYFACSEGHHVASGILNRYCLQPGITDVKSQVLSVGPWITQNLGKKIAMIFPDYAFGYDHRDNLPQAVQATGGQVIAKIAIPPTETSFTRYFLQIPKDTEVIYHVMVGPAVLNFARELGEFYGNRPHPELFGFIDSLETVDINSSGLEFLNGSHFWEGHLRYLQNQNETELFYRKSVGVDENGAAVENSRNVSAYGHMFSCWETAFIIKRGMEACNYRSHKDRPAFIEAIENFTHFDYGKDHPQGEKIFNGKTHQAFGNQFISRLQDKKLALQIKIPTEAGFYPDETDYTQEAF